MFNPYESAKPFFAPADKPGHVVDTIDQDRVQSYSLYDRIYWSVPQTFRLLKRGNDNAPIYLPSARKMIEACNRFLAVNFGILVTGTDSSEEKVELQGLVLKIFKRENFWTKFKSQKRYGLIRGDAMWHLVADPDKPEGERLSIYELDPATFFPIRDPDNLEKVIGCHLVDIIVDPDDPNKTKRVARRQTYRKEENGAISSELALFETNAWDDRNLKPADIKLIKRIKPKFELPPSITHLPVYMVPNNRIPGLGPLGYSELLGVERIFAAVNQAVSDEELSLAMAGLGVYWTTAGPPVATDGKTIVPWDIGPARMLEIPAGTEIGRLAGITSVAPMIDHMNFMLDETQAGLGIPDIAAGKVDVTVAESGISLQLQLNPLIAKNAEKEGVLIETYDQMFYDLVHGWLVAYEGIPEATTATVVSVAGDPMPKNRKGEIDELLALVNAKVISIQEFRAILVKKHGYEIDAASDGVIAEAAKRARAEDPFAQRLADEEPPETGGAGQGADNNGNTLPIPVRTS